MSRSLPVRFIRVTEARLITPHLRRVTFGGDDLADFSAAGPDQQVKLYFPTPGQARPRLPEPGDDGDIMRWYEAYNAIPEPERPWMRSYTLRAHDPLRRTIDIDFVLHDDAGPATRWAAAAKPGNVLGMFGPSAAYARPVSFAVSFAEADWVLLAGDETALPAIGTLAEALPAGTRALAFIEVRDAAEEQHLGSAADLTVRWLHRGQAPAGRTDLLLQAVRQADLPPGRVFAWIAGEAGTVRALRRHLVNDRGVPKRSIDFSGYWRLRLTQDDAPTDDDMADAHEQLAHARELLAASAEPGGPA
ncbi:siderophore-interacting protein [Thermopolyspora sp. NPDC052614]|uniref:siderophore-interacting protein n=1 Tax=Thermopolyspora sp. NPDC052614 TaxID=3155682 RepID=UPI00342FA268